MKVANRFFPVSITHIEKSTSDSSIISFRMAADLEEAFQYKHGQYITFRVNLGGKEVRRSYSLCSSPLDKEWKVGVRKIEGGLFSTYANEVLQVGDVLEAMVPEGKFFVETDADKQRNYVAFAAGSGITPILSIIKTHLLAEPKSTFKLFYSNQTVSSIMLKEELEALKNRFLDRFEIFYFLTQEYRNIPLFNGRLDQDKLEIIFKRICKAEEVDEFFCCGPEAMILMIREYLLSKGVDRPHIHFELFNTSGAQAAERRKIQKKVEGKVAHVTILEGGKSHSFDVAQGAENILDSALKNAADLPFACKGGVCCTCRARLVEGNVEMLVNYGLEQDEIEAGYILTCQALPVSEKVVVDFDR